MSRYEPFNSGLALAEDVDMEEEDEQGQTWVLLHLDSDSDGYMESDEEDHSWEEQQDADINKNFIVVPESDMHHELCTGSQTESSDASVRIYINNKQIDSEKEVEKEDSL